MKLTDKAILGMVSESPGRNDAGRVRRFSAALIQALSAQYQQHPGWTVQLHYDNLLALAEEDEGLGEVTRLCHRPALSEGAGLPP